MPPSASAATPAAYGQRRCGRDGGGGGASCGIGGTYGSNATGALASAITGIGACGCVPWGLRPGASGGGGGNAASALATSRIGVPRVSPTLSSDASGDTDPSASFFAISARIYGPSSSPVGSTMK